MCMHVHMYLAYPHFVCIYVGIAPHKTTLGLRWNIRCNKHFTKNTKNSWTGTQMQQRRIHTSLHAAISLRSCCMYCIRRTTSSLCVLEFALTSAIAAAKLPFDGMPTPPRSRVQSTRLRPALLLSPRSRRRTPRVYVWDDCAEVAGKGSVTDDPMVKMQRRTKGMAMRQSHL